MQTATIDRRISPGLKRRGPWLVAVATKDVDYDGRKETVTAGLSWVRPDHAMALDYPELWRYADGSAFKPKRRAKRKRSKPVKPANDYLTTSKPSWHIRSQAELNRTRAVPLCTWNIDTVTVELSREARRAIIERAQAAAGHAETGGGLFVDAAAQPGDKFVVTMASGPGPRANRQHGSMMLDTAHMLDLERDQFEAGTPKRWAGFFHTHPSGSGKPSERDLLTFAHCARALDLDGKGITFPAIIATPDPSRGWTEPRLTAWAVRHQPNVKPMYHAATIKRPSL
jgi:proteasome lid subunit RPN8/RPN11